MKSNELLIFYFQPVIFSVDELHHSAVQMVYMSLDSFYLSMYVMIQVGSSSQNFTDRKYKPL